MKIQERYLWIAAVILVAFFAQSQSSRIDNLSTLVTTYDMETKIQDAQINDFDQLLVRSKDSEYTKGFEAGKTQAAIVLMNKESLYNYTDGYHAATEQFADANALDISQSIIVELNNLRKMVPRLLNQVSEMEKNSLPADYVLDLFIDNLNSDIETEENYLEILDLLLSEDPPVEDTQVEDSTLNKLSSSDK